MKKIRKFKDELSRKDSKRIDKGKSKTKKSKLRPNENIKPKYRNNYLNEEE